VAAAHLAAPWFVAEAAHVRANLARVAPALAAREREVLVAGVFRHFALCFADLVTTNRRGGLGRLLAAVEGVEHLARAGAGGRGVVILTAHLGNWELGGRLLAARVARPTHVVVAAERDPGVERFLRGGPAPVRFVTVRHPADVVPLVAALRRGEIVALQGDRALGTRGDLVVEFFGAPAPFPRGPFVLARAAAASVLPAFCTLGRGRRYTITLGEPIDVPAGGEAVALAQWVNVLEHAVRRHPEQWFNFFDVWSSASAG
jgi:KDO2-lipid IV(A) lauroyltransferase